jgi:uncharacterized protein (DUF3084 family)
MSWRSFFRRRSIEQRLEQIEHNQHALLHLGARIMAQLPDVNASLATLAANVARLQASAASPADLDNVKAQVDAINATVLAVLPPTG